MYEHFTTFRQCRDLRLELHNLCSSTFFLYIESTFVKRMKMQLMPERLFRIFSDIFSKENLNSGQIHILEIFLNFIQ